MFLRVGRIICYISALLMILQEDLKNTRKEQLMQQETDDLSNWYIMNPAQTK